MAPQEMRQLFAFNAWATNRIFDALEKLPAEQVGKDLQSSHKSILNTLVHLVGAERAWCSRWTGATVEPFLTVADAPNIMVLKETWNKVGFETAKFLGSLSEKKLTELFEMKTSKGDVLKLVYWHSMLHVIDHSTYHRGQVVTMMRQLGAVPPNTGMNTFFRETAKLGSKSN
ncbi:MAG: DinB family protein [Bacteroidota bacterium]